jgi:hypothetical protein
MHDGAAPIDPLTWLVFIAQAEDGVGTVYDDHGDGFDFERGDFARFTLTCRAMPSIRLQLSAKEGAFTPQHSTMQFDLRGAARPNQITVNGAPTDDWEYTNGRLLIRLPATTIATEIAIE